MPLTRFTKLDMTSTRKPPIVPRPLTRDLSGLHRHLLGPKPPRPSTSYGSSVSQSCIRPPKLRLQPPPTLLPPYAPPRSSRVYKPDKVLLPSLLRPPRNPNHLRRYQHPPRRSVNRKIASNENPLIKKVTLDASTGIETVSEDSEYICRLCGFNCQSGDMLHSHILLLKHTAIKPTKLTDKTRIYDTLLSCRHCGVSWQLGQEDKRTLNHPCILQKAAYFKNILAPSLRVRQGLPFVCLFCNPEDDVVYKTSRRRTCKKRLPLRRQQTASRFASKLELALHIRYMHTPTREPGFCAGCPNYKYDLPEKQEHPEFHIWETSTPTTPPPPASPTPSTDSILVREGPHPLDAHIKDTHFAGYEYLAWLTAKRRRCGPTDLAAFSTKSKTAWMYACPLCQLQPFEACPSRPEMGLASNAMLQTHIACFHAAGASFLDWKLQVCQVCGESVSRGEATVSGEPFCPQQRHIVRRGHLGRVKELFSRSVNQGRVMLASETQGVEWRTTCVLCWRRFEDGIEEFDLGEMKLRAECRLQAHLLATHCLFIPQRTNSMLIGPAVKPETNVFSCGWCGGLREDPKGPGEPYRLKTGGFGNRSRLQFRRMRSQTELFANFKWAREHEREHAEAIFRWWWVSTSKLTSFSGTSRDMLWSRQAS